MIAIKRLLLAFILAAATPFVHAEKLSAALGCEIIDNKAKPLNISRPTRYVLLYKSGDAYTKVCLDEIGTSEELPLRCFDPDVSATSIWKNGNNIYGYSDTHYNFVLDRKDLILTVAPIRTTPKGGYQAFYQGNSDLLRPDFSDVNPDYRCQLSPDPTSTENFILNAKSEQLSSNKI